MIAFNFFYLFISLSNYKTQKSRDRNFSSLNERYKIVEEVGRGCYSTVYKGIDTESGKNVAIKKIRIFDKRQSLPKSFFREVAQMRKMNSCENSCKLLDVVHDSDRNICLILEFCDFDLEKLINISGNGQKGLPVQAVKCYFRQIVEALIELKKQNIIHRDLKPSNILVTRDNIVKLADYGLSRDLSKGRNNMTLNVSTPGYKAPEIILGDKNYSYSSDIWSLGVILFKMITGLQIFNPINTTDVQQLMSIFSILGKPTSQDIGYISGLSNIQVLDFIPETKNQLDDIIREFIPLEFFDAIPILKNIFKYNPQERITLEEILNSPFLQNDSEDNSISPLKLPFIYYSNETTKSYKSNYSSAELSISPISRPPRVEITPYL